MCSVMAPIANKLYLLLFLMIQTSDITFCYAQIEAPLPSDILNAEVGSDVSILWKFGNVANGVHLQWKFTAEKNTTEITIMEKGLPSGTPSIRNNFNCLYNSATNGGITLTGVTTDNSGTYRLVVTYTANNSDHSVKIKVSDKCICGSGDDLETPNIIAIVLKAADIAALVTLIIIIICHWTPPLWLKIVVTSLVIAIALFALIIGAITVYQNHKCRNCTSTCDIPKCDKLNGFGIANIVLFFIDVILLVIFWLVITQGCKK